VGRSLCAPSTPTGGTTRPRPHASVWTRVALLLPKLAWNAPRTIAAWAYRTINFKLYARIARIRVQLEDRISHLERELAYQIAENKASALHLRREIQMSGFGLASKDGAGICRLPEHKDGQRGVCKIPTTDDCAEAVA